MTTNMTMGPIERELRDINPSGQWWKMSLEAYKLCLDAESSLGIHSLFSYNGLTESAVRDLFTAIPDVLSEAIEFASENGL